PISTARDDAGTVAAQLSGRATRILFLAQHPAARPRDREPEQLVHVAQFLFDQCVAPRRCQLARSLPVGRRNMAGTVLLRQLTGARARGVEFAAAARADDADIRRLLRENP